jgi:hypothetical protein
MTFEIFIHDELNDANFGFTLRNVGGIVITGKSENLGLLKKGSTIKVRVSLNCIMNPAHYFLSCGLKSLVKETPVFQFRKLDFKELEVIDRNLQSGTLQYNGMVDLVLKVEV